MSRRWSRCLLADRRHDERNQARWGGLPSRQEPPDAEPHVRWCGRATGVTRSPTRLRPAGRTYLEVEVLYTPGKGKC